MTSQDELLPYRTDTQSAALLAIDFAQLTILGMRWWQIMNKSEILTPPLARRETRPAPRLFLRLTSLAALIAHLTHTRWSEGEENTTAAGIG